MKKTFKLPKDFATKWVEALRSEKYKQGSGALVATGSNSPTIKNSKFCCLGVGSHLCNVEIDRMVDKPYIDRRFFKTVPQEIGGAKSKLVRVLSRLNDGISKLEFGRLNKKYNFRSDFIDWWSERPEATLIQTPFKTIADFIEDNCEFIEEPKTV